MAQKRFVVAVLATFTASSCYACPTGGDMPQPFSRGLCVQSPHLTGRDVFLLQHFLNRQQGCKIKVDSYFGVDTEKCVTMVQKAAGLPTTGDFDAATAAYTLDHLTADGYKDDGRSAESQGYMYKVHIQVHHNRSIESIATLYSANNTALHRYTVRLHGHDVANTQPWPDYNSTGDGLNEFSPDGNTPTGLTEFDLNSPEDIPRLYGPYPVNRAVQGLKGNAAFLIPNIRDGILQHTGEWPNWSPPMVMPNSAGCIHAYPEDIKRVWKLLVAEGVAVRPNTDGKLPYPYKSQGLLSIEQI